MRTTLTLDPDVAARLEREMKRSGTGLKVVVNQALRAGLGMADKPVHPPEFRVEPHAFGFQPGTDLDRLNQLVDELGAEEAARKLSR
ncbi:MAG: antitoxin [Gemmatimonadetes bacterium]|nr:antitoxin [Gemmatimonadota bacterium]